jgi:hypothetical protein
VALANIERTIAVMHAPPKANWDKAAVLPANELSRGNATATIVRTMANGASTTRKPRVRHRHMAIP